MSAYYNSGRYWGRIVRQSLGQSKEKKTPQFCIHFQILGQVDLADPDGNLIPCQGYERTVFRYITEKTVDYLIEDLQRLGIELPHASWRYLDPDQQGFVDLSGKECEFYCEHEEYEGKPKEKWGLSRGGGQLTIEKMDEKAIKTLDNLFGKKLKELAKPKRAAPPAETAHKAEQVAAAEVSWQREMQEAAAGQEDDSIPF